MKFFKTASIVTVIAFFLCAIPLYTAEAVVFYTRGSSATFTWTDEQTDIEYYEVVLIRDGTSVWYGPYQTTEKSITIPRPKSGAYEVRVRGVRRGLYSPWCSSIGDGAILHTGSPGHWKVYFKLTGPSGPIIVY